MSLMRLFEPCSQRAPRALGETSSFLWPFLPSPSAVSDGLGWRRRSLGRGQSVLAASETHARLGRRQRPPASTWLPRCCAFPPTSTGGSKKHTGRRSQHGQPQLNALRHGRQEDDQLLQPAARPRLLPRQDEGARRHVSASSSTRCDTSRRRSSMRSWARPACFEFGARPRSEAARTNSPPGRARPRAGPRAPSEPRPS